MRGAGARCRGGGGGDREAASASAVGARVAELEALVDQREVGEQVVDGGVARRPASSRTSRCAAEAARRDRRAARRRSSSRRAGSRPGRPRSRAPRAPAPLRPARPGRRAARRGAERLQELERALLEPRLHVARRAHAARRARIPRRRAGSSSRARPPRAGRARGGPDRAEPLDVGRGHDADLGQAILERRVEEQLAPHALGVRANRGDLRACAADSVARRASVRCRRRERCRRGTGGR